MNITIDRGELIHTLELTSRVSTKHVTLPVLQCVLIEVTGSEATFTSTNLEISVEVKKTVLVEEAGVVAVPATTLLQAVQFISKEKVTLRLEGTIVIVEGGRGSTKINTLPADDFPKLVRVPGEGLALKGSTFALGIKSAAFAASHTSIKPELGSVFIQQKREHTLTFVATDSFRLLEKTVPQQGLVWPQSIMIPQKNALELARLCEAIQTDPQCYINENQCALSFGTSIYITTRLITGSFPDYEQIIPKEYSSETTVLKQDFVRVCKQSQIFLNKFQQVNIAVAPTAVTVSAQNGEVGATTDTIEAASSGSDITLNFNQQYLTEALPYFNDESITLRFAGIGRPLVIKGVSDTTVRYLVMPMNR